VSSRSSESGSLARLIETEDRWELPLGNRAVTQCRFDAAFTIVLDDPDGAVEIRIGEPFVLRAAHGDEVRLAPEDDPVAMGPALVVLRQAVESLVAFKDGRLELKFADGDVLCVPAGGDFEPWDVVGPAGLRIVSVPGREARDLGTRARRIACLHG
jgi:hypothetical protein